MHRSNSPRRRALRLVPVLLVGLHAASSARPGAATAGTRRAGAFLSLHSTRVVPARPDPEPGALRWGGALEEGASPRPEGTRFVVRSETATRIELELYGAFDDGIAADRENRLGRPERVLVLERRGDLWGADVEGVGPGEMYGLRAWGPNWPHDPAWEPGTEVGFLADVDAAGNRFNPNKLLIDPFTRALSRDPDWTGHTHASGPGKRDKDSAPFQAKSIVVDDGFEWRQDGERPRRMLKDSVIYEVHLKGLTRRFPDLEHAGTYRALQDPRVIAYLKDLGVTAVELLPLHEAPNDVNDVDPTDTEGKNYWGYMTLAYFAPDRRYSSDPSFDGPVREFKEMVRTLHENGLEVILDVVFNHTAEGGVWKGEGLDERTATIFSWRGLDNQLYYELAGGNQSFYDNTGIGANLRTAYPKVQDYLIRSMRYFTDVLHVDGFRFDLASVLGNSRDRDGFAFQKTGGFLDRIAREFGYTDNDPYANARKVKLIAEPWAIFDDTYQVGNFPWGWAEWNGKYRDTARSFWKGDVSAGAMMRRVNGSHDLYGDDGRRPHQSINFLTAHDGLTLFDLVSYDVNSEAERDALNTREWPYGPSDGGESHNHSWDSALPGDTPARTAARRRQQARNFFSLLMLSNGTPMMLGGDERLRTKHGNNNTYNLDNAVNWLEWGPSAGELNRFADRRNHLDGVEMAGETLEGFRRFARSMIRLRRAHPAFHAPGWWAPDRDVDGDGYPALLWVAPEGGGAPGVGRSFGYRLESAAGDLGMPEEEHARYPLQGDLLVLVNAGGEGAEYSLPAPTEGRTWRRLVDTHAWAEAEHGNAWSPGEAEAIEESYGLHPRSLVVLIER